MWICVVLFTNAVWFVTVEPNTIHKQKSQTSLSFIAHTFPQTCSHYPISCLFTFGTNNDVLTKAVCVWVCVFSYPELIKLVEGVEGWGRRLPAWGRLNRVEHKRIPGAIPLMPMWSFRQTGGANGGIWAEGGDKGADCRPTGGSS